METGTPSSFWRGRWSTLSSLHGSASWIPIGTTTSDQCRRTVPSPHFRAYILTHSMSRITENADCDDCNYPAHGGNDTGSRVHSIMDEDDELLRYIWTDYLHPKEYEWVLIVAYIVVFFVSLIGNSLGKWNFVRRSSLHSCVTNVAESLKAHFQITLRTNKWTYKWKASKIVIHVEEIRQSVRLWLECQMRIWWCSSMHSHRAQSSRVHLKTIC